MIKAYYFGIQNSRLGPFDEAMVAARVKDGSITRETLAWCEGMADWCPVQQVPELMKAFGALLTSGAQPPPLPAGPVVPPLPGAGPSLANMNEQAYRFVVWCYRPWQGKPSPLRSWVDADPKNRALPVALGTVAVLALIVVVLTSTLTENNDLPPASSSQSMQAGMASPADLMARQRAWQDAHTYSQGVIDDVYEYNRDSQDRRDDTYRRATYDWYGKDDK